MLARKARSSAVGQILRACSGVADAWKPSKQAKTTFLQIQFVSDRRLTQTRLLGPNLPNALLHEKFHRLVDAPSADCDWTVAALLHLAYDHIRSIFAAMGRVAENLKGQLAPRHVTRRSNLLSASLH